MARTQLDEVTNIGTELLLSGKITLAQLKQAQARNDEYNKNGMHVRFGDICRELGFVTEDDLALAEAAQQKARDVCAHNQDEIDDALKVLRSVAATSEKTPTASLRASVIAAKAS